MVNEVSDGHGEVESGWPGLSVERNFVPGPDQEFGCFHLCELVASQALYQQIVCSPADRPSQPRAGAFGGAPPRQAPRLPEVVQSLHEGFLLDTTIIASGGVVDGCVKQRPSSGASLESADYRIVEVSVCPHKRNFNKFAQSWYDHRG
jgi:hypothetical protein